MNAVSKHLKEIRQAKGLILGICCLVPTLVTGAQFVPLFLGLNRR